jgi:hypothetical protein
MEALMRIWIMIAAVGTLAGCAGVNVGFGIGGSNLGVGIGVGSDGSATVGVGAGGRAGNVGVGGSVSVPIGKVGEKDKKDETPPDTEGAAKRP